MVEVKSNTHTDMTTAKKLHKQFNFYSKQLHLLLFILQQHNRTSFKFLRTTTVRGLLSVVPALYMFIISFVCCRLDLFPKHQKYSMSCHHECGNQSIGLHGKKKNIYCAPLHTIEQENYFKAKICAICVEWGEVVSVPYYQGM